MEVALTGYRCCGRALPLVVAVGAYAGLAADASAQGSVAMDRAALEALYNATGGESWKNGTNWKTAAPLGEWHGVSTDSSGRVIGLRLSSNSLTGPIPVDLGNLSRLRSLSLGGNSLSGPIPAALGSLSNLESLFLFGNALTGQIPGTLANLSHLELLFLSSNELAGPIPTGLGSLSNLTALSFAFNELTGPIPVALGNLSNLESLSLSGNALTGTIPPALGSLSSLESLSLGFNELAGPIPVALGNLSNLESLSLSGNSLTGTIPPALGSLSHLTSLSLAFNELTGPIPVALSNLSNLESLSLRGNALTGPVPAALGSLSNLTSLFLSSNELTGPIPVALGNLSNLESLSLSGNNLTGPIPATLGGLYSLEALFLGGNRLTGPVPAWLGSLSSVEFLSLYGNALSGPIPSALASLANLKALSLGGNELTGMIPVALGSLSNLESLSLYWNALTGPIPAALGGLSNLESLSLTGNDLAGPVPAELTQLSELKVLGIGFTGLCVPAESPFQEWLATIDEFSGSTCNRPPEAVGAIPAQTLTASGTAQRLSLADYFRDPDNDLLTFAATSSDAGKLAATVSGSTAWLAPGEAGTATLTVTAIDPGGLRAAQALTVTVVASAGPQGDQEALAALYDETDGPSWTNTTNWKTAAPLGRWYGVTTDAAGRVTKLDLDENALTGPIPAALGSLSNLEELDLGQNALTGPIPAALGSLSNLESLDLSVNQLTGPLPPALGSLSGLESLNLGQNRLTGPIPVALGSLSSLTVLSLNQNALTGSIPTVLGNLSGLASLDLSKNRLTGPIPAALGGLSRLTELNLSWNALTGTIPAALGSLSTLSVLSLGRNSLTGPIPVTVSGLSSLEALDLSYSWALSGPLPDSLRLPSLRELNIWATQACAPTAWQEWVQANDFSGLRCGVEADVTIDVATVYTPAAREAAGGTAAIEAVIDLMIAETNEAYAASGVHHRVALVARSEVAYTETGDSVLDLGRLEDPSDGHLDEVHPMRDQVGADLVHLLFLEGSVGGIASLDGPFGLTCLRCGGDTFAHETGHNMGLLHDRYTEQGTVGTLLPHPAYGYVNQRTFEAGAAPSSRWMTIMAYGTQCYDANTSCPRLLRFSNPRQTWLDDPLGVAFDPDASGVSGSADAVTVLNTTGPVVAAWRDRMPDGANQPPSVVGELPAMQVLTLHDTVAVDLSARFVDPDGDALRYTALSASPEVATAQTEGASVTLTAVGIGTAIVRVTAVDPGGLTVTRTFMVSVPGTLTDSPESDHEALVALYEATGGPAWTNSTNWKTEAPLGQWHGVTADADGRVTGLSLVSNNLIGRLPATLANLSRLQGLSLDGNALSGPIPTALGDLSKLERLALRRNNFTGPIPATLVSMSSLEHLDLGSNALTGAIPEGLGGLSRLEWLDLGSNALSGQIPGALRGLSNLNVLDLSGNGLTGPVPEGLGSLSSLRMLTLAGNALTGPIPAALGNLSSLESLRLGQNALTRPIPASLGSLSRLRVLALSQNMLTGPVPAALGRLSNLTSLDLGRNELTGPMPSELTQLSRLTSLDIRYSGLCAPAGSRFEEWLASIEVFFGSSCEDNRSPERVGTIPSQTLTASGLALGTSVAAYFRDPDNDQLIYTVTSTRPDAVMVSASVSTLWLAPGVAGTATVTIRARDPGGLSATQSMVVTVVAPAGPQGDYAVLAEIYDATGGPTWTNGTNWKTTAPLDEWHGVTTDASGRVTELDLAQNGLTGPIPAALGRLANLEVLRLRDNALTGTIPEALSSLSNLDSLSRYRIAPTGNVPTRLGSLSNLRVLRLDGNQLTGSIPGTLASLSKLEVLDLAENAMAGPIPRALGGLSNLTTLSLTDNALTGPIPETLGSLAGLEELFLGQNALTGSIPETLGLLSALESLDVGENTLTGPIPEALGGLSRLEWLYLGENALSGPVPGSLGSLSRLEALYLRGNWGLSGSLPADVRLPRLRFLDIWLTQACAPVALEDWLRTITFSGSRCTEEAVTVDVAVFYTSRARTAAGGTAAIEAVIDLMIAETNQAYEASGVRHRVALVARSEVEYVETGDSAIDLDRLGDRSDGYLDEVHAIRNSTGADLVHLVFEVGTVSGIAYRGGSFGLTCRSCGGDTFAHELGHNMGLRHDRYQEHVTGIELLPHPMYGYVNQRAFDGSATPSSFWRTIMAYDRQCIEARGACRQLLRFSNPRQEWLGDPLGVPFDGAAAGVTGPADAAAVLNATAPAVAARRHRIADEAGQPQPAAGSGR